ncbi:MAG: aldose 1-epimerase [Pirellulaceae bacterium]
MTAENVTITDDQSGARATIVVGYGFNCHHFQAVCDGRGLDVLWSAPGFAEGVGRPSGSGIPILFPFPGRIRGTVMHWGGRDYQLQEGDKLGNAIHGFVHSRPWRVKEQSAAAVTGEFQASIDDPALLDCWPSDFRITAAYEIGMNSLNLTLRVANPGDGDLPFGLGLHPYFRVPLGGGDRDACRIRVPVSQRWELENMIASGRVSPVADDDQLSPGVRFGDTQLDAGFTGLGFVGDRCQAEVHDPGSGRTLHLTFDRTFPHCVVFNPPHREAICIEPYSCICDPFRLQREGVDAGLRVLPPGQSLQTRVELRVE